jgi:hypothetical protein
MINSTNLSVTTQTYEWEEMCVSCCNAAGSQIKIFPVHFLLNILEIQLQQILPSFGYILKHYLQALANTEHHFPLKRKIKCTAEQLCCVVLFLPMCTTHSQLYTTKSQLIGPNGYDR